MSETKVTGKKQATGDTEEPEEELSEANIDARVVAVKHEQEALASKIWVQKKLQSWTSWNAKTGM